VNWIDDIFSSGWLASRYVFDESTFDDTFLYNKSLDWPS
jgi:hypothetical protein